MEIHEQDFENGIVINAGAFNQTAFTSQAVNVSSNVEVNDYRILAEGYCGDIDQVFFSNSKQPQMFTELYDKQFVQGLRWASDDTFSYIAGSQVIIQNPEDEHYLLFAASYGPLKLEVDNLYQTLQSQGFGVSFDFSHLEQEYDIAQFQLGERGVISWVLDAPITGELPKLEMPNDSQQRLEKLKTLQVNVTLSGYGSIKGVDETRQALGELTEGGGNVDIYNEYRYESLQSN